MEGGQRPRLVLRRQAEPIAAIIDRMAALPIDAQPGEKFVYGYNTDILGVVVEKVSGQTLDEFFRTRISDPLGMADTQFYLPPSQRDRLAAVYPRTKAGTLSGRRTRNGPGRLRRRAAHVLLGWRRAFSDGVRLRAAAADDAERRRARRRPPAGPEDGRADDGPTTPARSSTKARPASASASKSSTTSAGRAPTGSPGEFVGAAPITGLLGRSEGEDRRRPHDAAAARDGKRPPRALPHAGLSGGRRAAWNRVERGSGKAAPRWRKPASKRRLEAFSDGVIAILITIMVLELKVPARRRRRTRCDRWCRCS